LFRRGRANWLGALSFGGSQGKGISKNVITKQKMKKRRKK
jgi:hypothetical protein